MSKTYEDLTKELDSKIPREVIMTREAGNGRTLDYLSGYYVIDRLNKVIGPGNWAYSSDVSKLHEGTYSDRYGKDVHTVHYSAKVRLVVSIAGKPTEFVDYGYGDGSDKTNTGKAHELAIKESITDGIKRCAKNLGMSFGLALYSKEQENVEESTSKVQPDAPKGNDTRTKDAVPKSAPTETKTGTMGAVPNRAKILEKISLTSKVIIDSKRDTMDNVLKMLSVFGVKSKEELTDEQALKLLNQLSEKLK